MHEILKVNFEWGCKPKPEQLKLLESYRGSEIEIGSDGTLPYHARDYEITLEEAFAVGIKFEVCGRTKYARLDDITKALDEFGPRNSPAPINQRCNVVVAGTSVIEISEVLLMTDSCTDELQRKLNDGWRIIAVCVQPDQRRPDYILGKVKP